jgi:NADH-quinone oxidoreductase subunit A
MELYIPITIMILIAIGFAVVSMFLGDLIGLKAPNKVKNEVYECGIETIGSARVQVPVKFYLVCLLFLLFDVETAFILTWALYFNANPSLIPFVAMLVFMGILVLGLLYEWKKGALKWQ